MSNDYLGGGFKHFLCLNLPGEMIQVDYIVQIGLTPPTKYNRGKPPMLDFTLVILGELFDW